MTRTIILRLFGLATAAVISMAALALLGYGLGVDSAAIRDWLDDVARLVAESPQEGQQALAAAGLLLVAVVALVLVAKPPRTTVKRLSRTPEGTTSLDLSSVAWAVQRKLRDEIDAGVRVRADGTNRFTAVVPTYGDVEPLAAVDEVGVALPEILAELGVSTKTRVVTGPPAKSRVR